MFCVEEQNSVLSHDADDHDHSHERRDVERRSGNQQAHETALRNHPLITVADLKALAAKQVTRQFQAGFFPNLSANVMSVGTADQNTRLGAVGGLNNPLIFDRNAEGLNLTQLITDFGRTANLAGSARLRAQAEADNARATASRD